MADQANVGAHLLYFPYTIATTGQQLSFKYQIRNWSGDVVSGGLWATPNNFDTTGSDTSNQQVLAYVSTTVPSLSDYPPAANILLRPAPGDPMFIPPLETGGYATFSTSLDAWAGQTIYITFGQAVTYWFTQFGIDDIQVTCAA